jgi:hypothetical protein
MNLCDVIFSGEHLDGIDQWPLFRDGAAGMRKEFIYNIDEFDQNAAIR